MCVSSEKIIKVIGGGLAGVEAAWYLANHGAVVYLYEMRPLKMTPAHKTDYLAELVCSNSFKTTDLSKGAGLLKAEMEILGSLVLMCAKDSSLPGGSALIVDRETYAQMITEKISSHPLITVVREEVARVPLEEKNPVVIATGPLTSLLLAADLQKLLGENYLYFYDAIAPVITADSVDRTKAYEYSRYNKGEAAYLNCPFTEEEYKTFWENLRKGDQYPLKDFEKPVFFEGCLPIEEMAERGIDTLRFGPMKPVGLPKPNGEIPYAVVQLRPENKEKTLYNLVGFQTRLRQGEQERIFRLIPGLENCQFVRFGMIHRNLFINAPTHLQPTLQLKSYPSVLFAGQISSVEGYLASAATGIIAGINALKLLEGKEPVVLPTTTILGALLNYITTANPKNFQPMNANFGLLPPLEQKVKGKSNVREEQINRAVAHIKKWSENYV